MPVCWLSWPLGSQRFTRTLTSFCFCSLLAGCSRPCNKHGQRWPAFSLTMSLTTPSGQVTGFWPRNWLFSAVWVSVKDFVRLAAVGRPGCRLKTPLSFMLTFAYTRKQAGVFLPCVISRPCCTIRTGSFSIVWENSFKHCVQLFNGFVPAVFLLLLPALLPHTWRAPPVDVQTLKSSPSLPRDTSWAAQFDFSSSTVCVCVLVAAPPALAVSFCAETQFLWEPFGEKPCSILHAQPTLHRTQPSSASDDTSSCKYHSAMRAA